MYADFKESVHHSLTHSDTFFRGTNPSKRSFTGQDRTQVSGVKIGLNEAKNDVHLITAFCDLWK